MNRISVVFVFLCVIGCANPPITDSPPPVSWNHCYETFAEHVVEVAGEEAKNCGFFTLQAPESDKEASKECLKSQLESAGSFRVGHQSYGDDSMFCDVAIRDINGTYWSFYYDSDISGGSGGPSAIWIFECQEIELQPGTIGRDSFFRFEECQERRDVRSELLSK